MAKDILVYAPDSPDPFTFETLLGSEAFVREYWSEPANQLGLALVGSIYGRGFYDGIIWSGAELDTADEELTCLEGYWSGQGYGPELLAQLRERCLQFRAAIQIAKQRGCILSIS